MTKSESGGAIQSTAEAEEPKAGEEKRIIDHRTMVSSAFITLLVGIAFKEMADAFRSSLREAGITWDACLLVGTFFVISMRFFIGNQLHLVSKSVVKLPGLLWLYDLLVIVVESWLIMLAGGFCAPGLNESQGLGFLDFVLALYCLDVLWIGSKWVVRKVMKTCYPSSIPWGWAVVNMTLLVCMLGLQFRVENMYSILGLSVLFGLNLVGFIIDVVLIDHYDTIREPGFQEE